MAVAKMRSAKLQRPHLALMSFDGGMGWDTVSTFRIPWGLKLSILVQGRTFSRWENWGHVQWIDDRPGLWAWIHTTPAPLMVSLKSRLSENYAEKTNKWTNKTLDLFTGCFPDGDWPSRALRSGAGRLAKSLSFWSISSPAQGGWRFPRFLSLSKICHSGLSFLSFNWA